MSEDKKPENPNAFPHGYGTDVYERCEQGMTLRDYFAAKAMQSVLSNQELFIQVLKSAENGKSTDAVASNAYSVADAMLKQREL